MNGVIKIITNVSIKILQIIIILLLCLYFGLWIFVNNSIPKDIKNKYNRSNLLELSDEQYQIIWFIWTNNKNYEFKWYPFLIDAFYMNKADSYASMLLLWENDKYKEKLKYSPNRLPVWNMEYGLARYIKNKNNYKKCLSVILSNSCMGNEIYGIENACKYYFNKNLENITERELISLSIITLNYTMYEIGGIRLENKLNEILSEYYK